MSPFSGFILIDKPSGPTSHDIVVWARRVLHERRIGHCGTLDPLASGLLILAVGDALEAQEEVVAERKVYRGKLRLGLSTDTDDITGRSLSVQDPSAVTLDHICLGAKQLEGHLMQRVPRYSAVKFQGRKLYEWARDGVMVELPVRGVEVSRFQILSFTSPDVEFMIECSKGTYVRALARDLGEKLGVGGTLTALTREAIGALQRKNAYPWLPGQPNAELLQKASIPLATWRAMGQKNPSAAILATHP